MGGRGSGQKPNPRDASLLDALRRMFERREAKQSKAAEERARKAFRDRRNGGK